MSKLHFINVDPGDCTIIEHNSGNVTMIDICDGFTPEEIENATKSAAFDGADWTQLLVKGVGGNFQMKANLTNPVEYLDSIGINSIFRFILTHPDMDHMDGLKALADAKSVSNFWDTGVNKPKPTFSGSPYREEDWDQYRAFVAGKNTTYIKRLAGERFQFANQNANKESGGDGLYILAPDKGLVEHASESEDYNEASYVILYRSAGGRILIPGDAHDKSWEFILGNSEKDVANCSVMIAPHHGRDSGRTYDFLDKIRPQLTLFGNAPSEHLAYAQWNKRGLPFITSNQAGNVVLECKDGRINVFVENESFAKKAGQYSHIQNSQGYYLYEIINEIKEGELTQSDKASVSQLLASIYGKQLT